MADVTNVTNHDDDVGDGDGDGNDDRSDRSKVVVVEHLLEEGSTGAGPLYADNNNNNAPSSPSPSAKAAAAPLNNPTTKTTTALCCRGDDTRYRYRYRYCNVLTRGTLSYRTKIFGQEKDDIYDDNDDSSEEYVDIAAAAAHTTTSTAASVSSSSSKVSIQSFFFSFVPPESLSRIDPFLWRSFIVKLKKAQCVGWHYWIPFNVCLIPLLVFISIPDDVVDGFDDSWFIPVVAIQGVLLVLSLIYGLPRGEEASVTAEQNVVNTFRHVFETYYGYKVEYHVSRRCKVLRPKYAYVRFIIIIATTTDSSGSGNGSDGHHHNDNDNGSSSSDTSNINISISIMMNVANNNDAANINIDEERETRDVGVELSLQLQEC